MQGQRRRIRLVRGFTLRGNDLATHSSILESMEGVYHGRCYDNFFDRHLDTEIFQPTVPLLRLESNLKSTGTRDVLKNQPA